MELIKLIKKEEGNIIRRVINSWNYLKTIKSFGALLQDTNLVITDYKIEDDEIKLYLNNLIEFEKIDLTLLQYRLNAMLVDTHRIDFNTSILTFNVGKTNEYNRLPKQSFERLEAVLRYLNVKYTYINAIENDFESNIEYWVNIDFKKFSRMQESIRHRVGFKNLNILENEGNIIFNVRKENKEIFYLEDVLEVTNKPKNMVLPCILGVTSKGRVYFDDITKMVHILIGGTTGSGKSETLKQLLDSLLYYNDNVFLYAIDFKESALRRYKRFQKRCKYIEPEYSEIIKCFEELISEYKYRKKLFADYEDETGNNCPDIHQWNKLHPNSQLPFVVIAIDEATSFKDEFSKNEFDGKDEVLDHEGEIKREGVVGISPLIMTLLSKGRSLGMHLIFAVQKSTEQCFSVKWRNLCSYRICHFMKEKRQVQYILDCDVALAEKVMKYDLGMHAIDLNGKYLEIKSCLTSQELLNNIIKYYDEMEGELENVEVAQEEEK